MWSVFDWASNNGRKGKLCDNSFQYALSNPDVVSSEVAALFAKTVEHTDSLVALRTEGVFFLIKDRSSGEGRVILGDIGSIIFSDDARHPIEERNPQTIFTQNYQLCYQFFLEMNLHLDVASQLSVAPLRDAYEAMLAMLAMLDFTNGGKCDTLFV